jgi:RNA polymerase sigma-70 factor, ECF subfamily
VSLPRPSPVERPRADAAPVLVLHGAGMSRRTDREGRLVPDRAQMDLWVARMRSGDAGALREVVEAFSERLTAVVSGLLRDRDAVDDVVQETFVKAYTRIASFKGDAGLFTWLYRIAVNASKDLAKARGRRPAGSIEDLPSGATGLPHEGAPSVERLEDREERLLVRSAVAKLPARFRAVLVLREIEGMAYEQIAQVLNLSLGTVESRLFRARRRLKALLERAGMSA